MTTLATVVSWCCCCTFAVLTVDVGGTSHHATCRRHCSSYGTSLPITIGFMPFCSGRWCCQARTAEGPDLQRQVRTLMSLPSTKTGAPRMRTNCDPCLQSQDAPQERIDTDQFGHGHHFYQDSARLSKIQSRGRAEKVFVLENPSTYISKRVCRSLVAVRPARLRSHPRVAELKWRLTLYAR